MTHMPNMCTPVHMVNFFFGHIGQIVSSSFEIQGECVCGDSMPLCQKWAQSGQYKYFPWPL